MSDGIHATMDRMQHAAFEPPTDRAAANPSGQQLPTAHDSVLRLRQLAEHSIYVISGRGP